MAMWMCGCVGGGGRWGGGLIAGSWLDSRGPGAGGGFEGWEGLEGWGLGLGFRVDGRSTDHGIILAGLGWERARSANRA